MATRTSYSHAREHLASLWDEVEDSREAAVIHRRGHEDMALIPADELSSLRETAYLLRSPENMTIGCGRSRATKARLSNESRDGDAVSTMITSRPSLMAAILAPRTRSMGFWSGSPS